MERSPRNAAARSTSHQANITTKASDSISDFHATRYIAPTAAVAAKVPSIDGVWEIPHESAKGEKAWRLIVKQNGPEIETTILRVDGDLGALTGGWQDGKFIASHFDGARPVLVLLTPTEGWYAAGRCQERTG